MSKAAKSVVHSTFSIEREYPAAPERVFDAFKDPAKKRLWFAEGDGFEVERYDVDFRVGGLEHGSFRFQGGPLITNDTLYQDIVPNSRIVIAYSMAMEGKPFSCSLATMEFIPTAKGTNLIYTEQGAFLDGADSAAAREEGCRGLLEVLAKYVN